MQINGKVVLTENSSTPAYNTWQGGKGTYIVEASGGWGTVILKFTSPNGTDITVKDINGNACSAGANGMFHFDLPPGQIIAVISSATAVYAYAVGRHQ